LGQLVGEAAKLEKLISFAVQVTSFDGVRRMVESGPGIAILPDGVTQGQSERGRLSVVPLSDTWSMCTQYVGCLKSMHCR
jgi:DNA-binding transcriptional LysR family regulator